MVRALALSPDGRLLAVVTSDRRLVFWDVAAAKDVASWPNSQTIPKCVAFRPDGKSVAVGCADSTILLYDVPAPPEPAPIAADELDQLWADLASADATVAYRAIARLARTRKRPLSYSRERLRPVPAEAPANGRHAGRRPRQPRFCETRGGVRGNC